ncbi:DUF305 domain-containing protein [Roseomonas sp. 573]|uniref:DUF305 domain-containing protein n=1 Tax=Roseomonas haemaphysalidis TaxID=2768162 RepID=A0ABS3KW70_9PROT|nr:DUF305 domain-containing protein [Roseomonas haemaphysalidis]
MARAQMGPGDAYDSAADDNAPFPRTWWDLSSAAAVEAGQQANLRYVEGMRPHHAGALMLARDYLASRTAATTCCALAQSIIPNQGFEILLLDEVGRLTRIDPSGPGWLSARPMATERLGYHLRFQKLPPGLGALIFPGSSITACDIRFAKELADD